MWFSIPKDRIEEVPPEEVNWVFPRVELAEDGKIASVELFRLSESRERASGDSNKLIRFQAKRDATAEEIHEALHATLDANPPPKITWPLRDVTGTPEGGDRQIIGAPPPPKQPPA